MSFRRIEALNTETGERLGFNYARAQDAAQFINEHREPPWILLAQYTPGVDRDPFGEWDREAPIFTRIKALEAIAGIQPPQWTTPEKRVEVLEGTLVKL